MTKMDFKQCLKQAQDLADKAKARDTLKIGDDFYSLEFKPTEWVYSVHDGDGNFVTNFNTKKISQAKKWLKEYLSN
jgi:hypothetical protein